MKNISDLEKDYGSGPWIVLRFTEAEPHRLAEACFKPAVGLSKYGHGVQEYREGDWNGKNALKALCIMLALAAREKDMKEEYLLASASSGTWVTSAVAALNDPIVDSVWRQQLFGFFAQGKQGANGNLKDGLREAFRGSRLKSGNREIYHDPKALEWTKIAIFVTDSKTDLENNKRLTKPGELLNLAKRIQEQVRGWSDCIETVVSAGESRTTIRPDIKLAYDKLFHFDGGFARAVRLFGAAEEFISEDRIVVHYQHSPLKLSAELSDWAERNLERQVKEDAEKRIPCFNGPNTRLMDWSYNVHSGDKVALEWKELTLRLGPVGWFEYKSLNYGYFSQVIPTLKSAPPAYTGISDVIDSGNITTSGMSNILDTLVVIVTSDAKLLYSVRGAKTEAAGIFTATVAENINRYQDDAEPNNSRRLRNVGPALGKKPDANYKPKGVPHPFAAVRRGIREELSPKVADFFDDYSIKLSGISWNLDFGHPNLLFVAAFPGTEENFRELCRKYPGKDYSDGNHIRSMSAIMSNAATKSVIQEDNWDPGGHAAVIRALELVETIGLNLNGGYRAAFEILRKEPPRRCRGN